MDTSNPHRVVRDKHGNLQGFRPLSLAELIEVERRLGGSVAVRFKHMTHQDALYILSCALELPECDVLPLFDGPSAARALFLIFGSHLQAPEKAKTKYKGSQDDITP